MKVYLNNADLTEIQSLRTNTLALIANSELHEVTKNEIHIGFNQWLDEKTKNLYTSGADFAGTLVEPTP